MHVHTCTCTRVYMYTCTCVQVYTYMHLYLTKETLALNLKGKRQNGRQAKLPTTRHASTSVLCTQNLQTRENTLSTRDDKCVHRERRQKCSHSRDDECVHRERQQTCSPQETTNEFTARNYKRVHRERRRTVFVL